MALLQFEKYEILAYEIKFLFQGKVPKDCNQLGSCLESWEHVCWGKKEGKGCAGRGNRELMNKQD